MRQVRSNGGACVIGRHEAPEGLRGRYVRSAFSKDIFEAVRARSARKASTAMVRHLNNIRKGLTYASRRRWHAVPASRRARLALDDLARGMTVDLLIGDEEMMDGGVVLRRTQ
jgi:hypothetical protein